MDLAVPSPNPRRIEVTRMQPQTELQELYRNRNRSVARSFYRQLRTEGFTHQQIIELSTTLLDFVTEDLKEQSETASK